MARVPLVLGLLTAAVPAAGQRAVEVPPGGVATVVATVTGDPGEGFSYALRPAEGVRVFGPAEGTVTAGDEGVSRIPFTVGLPTTAEAGRFVIGRVETRGPGAGVREQELAVRVAARRDVIFWLEADTLVASPSDMIELGYRMRNRGNVADTFGVDIEQLPGWEASAFPARVPLEPGDSAAGIIRLVPPRQGAAGEHAIRVELAGAGVARQASVMIALVSDESWIGDLAQIPGEVFVGSSGGADPGTGVALQAAGTIRPGTRMTLALRHVDSPIPPTAFRRELSGPRVRLAMDGRDWHVAGGDVFMAGDAFSGPYQQGRGIEARGEHGRIRGAALLAVPTAYLPLDEDGHLVQARGELGTTFGRVGARFSSVARAGGPLGDFRASGGGLSYELHGERHRVDAMAGYVRVGSDSAHEAGFAATARYRWDGPAGSVTARLQTTPGTTRRATSYGREAFLSGMVWVSPRLALTGWGFATAAPIVNGEPFTTSRGGAAGFRLDVAAHASLDVTAGIREADEVGDLRAPGRVRSVRTAVGVPLGAAHLEGDIELGTTTDAETRPYRDARLGVRWLGGKEWAWVGLSHYDPGLGTASTRVDLAGSLNVRAARLQGGFNAPVGRASGGGVSLWTSLDVPVDRDFDLIAGIDYAARGEEAARVALGVRRRIGVPLPLSRSAVLEGVVFEDRNGDRLRGPDEPVLRGIEVQLGALRAVTDDEGRFRFFDASRGRLRIPPTALPPGTVIPVGVYLPSTGTVDIPVVRMAVLELEVFLDRDGDGVMDAVERHARGAVVSLIDSRGRPRDGGVDAEGWVRFPGLEPGEYLLRIRRPGRGDAPFERRLTVEPGSRVRRAVAVPLRGREIRLPEGRP